MSIAATQKEALLKISSCRPSQTTLSVLRYGHVLQQKREGLENGKPQLRPYVQFAGPRDYGLRAPRNSRTTMSHIRSTSWTLLSSKTITPPTSPILTDGLLSHT
ncbi:hypothetical protein KC19_VG101100 [Ceratodon purpureus]|uniref:Uncharacterized protein n=1 Tax=Ceratodon purpureus TaxID=3225 RepID=A0A8T0HNS1_CERPU|nr:hypothetical protein KC19_VG101100 [Ceratodon purpureus]